jgi:UPF0716 protein FxsA
LYITTYVGHGSGQVYRTLYGNKFMWLLLIFILLPLIEIALFIQVGGLIGLWPTLAIVVALAFFGSWLVRTQGAMAFADMRRSMADFRDPTEPAAHGAMIMFAGLLLMTPGLFTDAIGLLLLIRPLRSWAIAAISRRFTIVGVSQTRQEQTYRPASKDVIDGEFIELGEKDLPNRPSGWTRH